MAAYYNEIDPFAAAWLRELIKAGQIADGEVDERSIVDVRPDDLRGFTQCHFFAGIGGWAYALQLAGWPDDREVWTGSCPCQPWSMAGAGTGASDPRHLWPAWFPLIRERRPPTVFGEQTASKDGLYWLDLVHHDLEAIDYAVAPFDLPAACVAAPHRRQRLWFVADTGREQWERRPNQQRPACETATERQQEAVHDQRGGAVSRVADALVAGQQRLGAPRLHERRAPASGDTPAARDADGARRHDADGRGADGDDRHEPGRLGAFAARPTAPAGGAGFWADVEWLACTDGKARPVEPGTFPLAHGIPARVGRLRGYGNAIVPQVAAKFISAYLEVRGL